MNINDLIAIVKKKLQHDIKIENIKIEDKSFLHKKHLSHQNGKFHLKISIASEKLKQFNRIDQNKIVHKVLEKELKNNIHSIQILIR